MKKIFLLIILFCGVWTFAADLEASITDADPGEANGAVDLSVTGGVGPYTYSWTGPDGFISSDEDLIDVESGIYTVTVTDQYCGVATMEIEVGVQNFSTIAEGQNTDISVYPNPTRSIVFIQSDEPVKSAVYSSSGQEVISADIRNSVDLSGQAPGLYFVHIFSSEGLVVRKVTLQ